MIPSRIQRPFGVPYLDYVDGRMETRYRVNYTLLTANYLSANSYTLSDTVTDGWFVVASNVTAAQRIVCSGDVKLILVDGKTLDATKGGVGVNNGSTLTVYGQTSYEDDQTAETMGKLKAGGASRQDYAAIGSGQNYGTGYKVTINGGYVEAVTGNNGAAIGGGNNRGANVEINGGYVKATATKNGAAGAAIGGGGGTNSDLRVAYGSQRITINGGYVQATATGNTAAIGGGSTDGSGRGGPGGIITITGGTVIASSSRAAAIGGGLSGTGENGSAGTITITGGTINATSESGTGIGGGGTNTDGTLHLDWADSDGASGLPRITASSYQVNTINYSTAAHTFAATAAPTTALTTEEIKTLTDASIIPTEVT